MNRVHRVFTANGRRRIAHTIGFGLVMSASGCSSSATSTHEPTTILACVPVPTAAAKAPQLVYPISGAVGISTAPGTLVFAGRIDNVTAILEAQPPATPATGPTPILLGPFAAAPSPIPSPHAAISDATILSGIAYPPLLSQVTYRVAFVDHPPVGTCAQVFPAAGFFTTQ